jgi:ABC-2 type transport system permease protein
MRSRSASHDTRLSGRPLAVLVRHNLLLMRREPGPLLSRMLLPIVFLTLLRPLYLAAWRSGEAGNQQAVIATLVTFSLLALSISGSAILTERLGRTWDRLRATALPPVTILAGKAIPAYLVLLGQQLFIIGFAAACFGLRLAHPALLLLVLFTWSCTLLCLGALLGVLVRSIGALSASYDIGGMLLSSLGGALVPLTVLPHWVRSVAPVSPGYWVARSMRAAFADDVRGVLLGSLILAGIAVVCGTLAATRLRGARGRLVAL